MCLACDRRVSELIMGASQMLLTIVISCLTPVWKRMLSLVRDAREPPMTDFLDLTHVWEEDNGRCLLPAGCSVPEASDRSNRLAATQR